LKKALDLFCCCGGAAKGLAEAGFDVTGVDITDGHDYPFTFIQNNVFNLSPDFLGQFDLIWASPPCQHYSYGTRKFERYKQHPDLVGHTRELLKKTGKPYIIENVVGAPLRKDLRLCGIMFGLRVIRHRIFEIEGFTVLAPPHEKHVQPERGRSHYAQVAGHGGESYSFKMEDWKKAMGIDHINRKEHLTQAVPPAYSHYISQFAF
jgi:DNA (cytosine-5)-methyltransferase 1